jgi:hypothetical protein
MFPDDFALRGYPEHPDSSDIHKPLYGTLKREGLIRGANKTFALTPRGVESAQRLSVAVPGVSHVDALTGERMTRDVRVEIDRMLTSAAFKLFLNGQAPRILDTDFYAFLGCTVRTSRNDFLGRLTTTGAAIETANKLGQPDRESSEALKKTWDYLEAKFKQLVDRRMGKKQ